MQTCLSSPTFGRSWAFFSSIMIFILLSVTSKVSFSTLYYGHSRDLAEIWAWMSWKTLWKSFYHLVSWAVISLFSSSILFCPSLTSSSIFWIVFGLSLSSKLLAMAILESRSLNLDLSLANSAWWEFRSFSEMIAYSLWLSIFELHSETKISSCF